MALSDRPYLASLCERDMDFLLLEEFHAEPDFVRWFASKATWHPPEKFNTFHGAWHSVCDNTLGESDLLLLTNLDTEKHALLIENKITADAQPDQGMRYLQRGEQGKIQGEWQGFTTCIVAPSSYLGTDPEPA